MSVPIVVYDACVLHPPSLRTREMMCLAVPECLVTDYEETIDALDLPDPDDRHVLAAAIRSGATTIVTANLKDFPTSILGGLGAEAVHPDDFVSDLVGAASGTVIRILNEQVGALRSPPRQLAELLETLERNGLVRAMAAVRALVG